MVEGLAEMGFPGQHFHGDTCQFLTGLIHGCRIFGQHIFLIRRDFIPVFVYFDSTDFDDFSFADAARFLLVPADRVHLEIDKYGFHLNAGRILRPLRSERNARLTSLSY